MVNNRTFCISGSIFSRYQTIINLDMVDSVEDIIKVIIKRMKYDMQNYPSILIELDREEKKFHMHDYKFGDILISEPEQIFYICSHC